MNFNHLEIFHAVAGAGSVTRGAEQSMISQPAASKQIRLLERALGVELFERKSKPLELTDAGKMLSRYARRIFDLAGEAKHALEDLQHLRRGKIAIGSSTNLAVYLLPELIVKFRDRFPGIRLHLETGNASTLRRRMREHAFDLALSEVLIEDPELDVTDFARDPFVAIAPPHHPLASRRMIKLEELCAQPFVVRDAGSGRQSFIEKELSQRGLSIRPAIALGSTEAVKRAVAVGLGCAIVPRRTVDLELATHKLARLNVRDLSIQRPLYRYQSKGLKQSKAVIAFLCLLKHAVHGTLPPIRKR